VISDHKPQTGKTVFLAQSQIRALTGIGHSPHTFKTYSMSLFGHCLSGSFEFVFKGSGFFYGLT